MGLAWGKLLLPLWLPYLSSTIPFLSVQQPIWDSANQADRSSQSIYCISTIPRTPQQTGAGSSHQHHSQACVEQARLTQRIRLKKASSRQGQFNTRVKGQVPGRCLVSNAYYRHPHRPLWDEVAKGYLERSIYRLDLVFWHLWRRDVEVWHCSRQVEHGTGT